MALFISSLNSGSNGNCYYVGNEQEAILVDSGISKKEVEKRLKRLELSISKIKAIIVTHEHGDHTHGIPALSRKYRIPVFITANTLNNSSLQIPEDLVRNFSPYEPINVGNLLVTAFPKRHDACEPHSVIVSCNKVYVGVFTDIGYPCDHVINNFQLCHAAFLETNYDEDMLENGRYPYALKTRIRSGFGHLSNRQALKLFKEHKPPFMSHLFLSHLSHENNSPRLVAEMFTKVCGKTEIIIASREEETSLYKITADFSDLKHSRIGKAQVMKSQLTLF